MGFFLIPGWCPNNAHLELPAGEAHRGYERGFHAKLAKVLAKGTKQLAISY